MQSYARVKALTNALDEQIAELDPSLTSVDGACQDGAPGMRKWGFGTIACVVEGDTASVLWTDQRSRTLGRIDGPADDLSGVFSWWQDNARALGRPEEPEPAQSPEPEPSDAPPLKRVPGAPRAISCAESGEPIVDQHGRIWSVDKVDFEVRGNFERVVVHLEQVGSKRNVRDTQVTVERMPVAQLKRAVPNAPKPKGGKTAIVVNLKGVRNAPGIRGYRPSSTDIIKEFSIVSDGGSRAAVVSTALGTCYQVRVPIFGPSASGRESKAEVYIDLK